MQLLREAGSFSLCTRPTAVASFASPPHWAGAAVREPEMHYFPALVNFSA
jgi:hypothetical protein